MRRITVTLIIAILMISTPALAQRRDPDAPAKAARQFILSLVQSQFDRSWHGVTGESQKKIARMTINRFEDLDGAVYTLESMMHLLLTNSHGHRTVMFEDMTRSWCQEWGIEVKDLEKVKVEVVKGNPDNAVVRLSLGDKSTILEMVNPDDWRENWKAIWHPPIDREILFH